MKYLLTLILEHSTETIHNVTHEIRTVYTIIDSENPEHLVKSLSDFIDKSVKQIRSKHNQDFRPISHSITKL